MANYVFIASSIDGYIAKENGGIDWLNEIPNPEKSDFGYSEFIKKIDGLVMGRKTFEKVLSFDCWPYHKKVFVLSNSLKNLPKELEGKVEIVNGDLKNLTISLNKKGYKSLYIDGGKTIQSFLKEDLIDEITITIVPTILGKGIKLFSAMDREIKFQKVTTKLYNNYLLQTTYEK